MRAYVAIAFCLADVDANRRGSWVHGDGGQRDDRGVQLRDPGNGRDADARYGDIDADGGDGCGVDGHGQRYGNGGSGTGRELHVFGGSGGGRVVQLGGEFGVHEPAGAD